MKIFLRMVVILIATFLFIGRPVWAQELEGLSISNPSVEPNIVSSGNKALISCVVTHPLGSMSITRVGANYFHEDWVTAYPTLYDDGSHGDKVAEDGIYSIEIRVGNTPGEGKIVFSAVDTEMNEIESVAIILKIQ
jgi:hypothetical protein